MFVRVKKVRSGEREYSYVNIVESRRDEGRVRQRVVANLGRLDVLQAKGDLLQVIQGLVAQCPQVRLVQAERVRDLGVERDRSWGPVLIFERLWEELGMPGLFHQLTARTRYEFDVERCAFAIVLQRILAPGSDRKGAHWVRTVEARGFERLRLAHFYKTVGLLWRWKDRIERHLYERGLDLFNQGLDLVFFDTTSTYFEGTNWEGWAKRGFSRDHRPDHLQLVLGVVMRRDGLPVSCEIWPGNTADVKTLVPVVKGLQKRFKIGDVVLVCDRGMVSAANLQAIEKAGYKYIVGMKMRRLLEVREQVLRRAGRYREVKHNLHVKEVWVDDRRYVICLNPERAKKDREDREAIVAKLEDKLRSGGVKSLIRNRGYGRYLKVVEKSVEVDQSRIKQEERYDGKFVLRTTTDLPASEVAEAYKQLTWIERLWRELKDVVAVRPIYHHQKKDNVRGHIFGSFLALYLTAELRRRLEEQWSKEHPEQAEREDAGPPRLPVSWDQLLTDLADVRALYIRVEDELYRMRTELKGNAGLAFRASGVRPPALAERVDQTRP